LWRWSLTALFACSAASCAYGGGPGTTPATGAPRAATSLLQPPEIVSSHGVAAFHLSAVTSSDGFPAFLYKGKSAAPTIRVNPGDTIAVDIRDDIAGTTMAADMNLHFHGLGVSPKAPSDDVLTMLAMPGQTLHYVVHVPKTQPPGLYWYHPHVHGETEVQVGLGEMSGAIVVGGIEKHYPALAGVPEHILIVREVGDAGGTIERIHRHLHPHIGCAPFPKDWLTVNYAPNPTVAFVPGKPQFFRVLNASGDRTLDLAIDGVRMKILGIDGFPVDTYADGPATLTVKHFVIPPAGRVEFLATMSAPTALRTLCYDSGPVGDPDPAQLLAHLAPGGTRMAAHDAVPEVSHDGQAPARLSSTALPPPAAHRVVTFSENSTGTEFYINGKAFDPSAPPTFVVHTGTVERWTVNNSTDEMHDFHLHQTHFLVVRVNGIAVEHPVWTDTFVVPWRTKQPDGSYEPGKIELIADFRSPIIRGTFVFHCHILNHEDHGMMAKIKAI
jgi:suppressor of ftsI